MQSCIDGASRMFPAESKKSKKARKSMGEDKGKEKELPAPIDVLVDAVIGFLEKGTAYMNILIPPAPACCRQGVQPQGTKRTSRTDAVRRYQ